jgi:hypothetical protein
MKCPAPKLKLLDIDCVPVKCRLLCHGLIINLVVKAFIWGNDAEMFDDGVDYLANKDDEEAELLLWRKKAPLGKLHKIIT